MKLKIPYDKQENDYDCGPASLQMAFDYFKFHISQYKLEKEGKTNPKTGTNHENMIHVARKNGFHTYVNTNSSVSEIKEFLKQKKPIIVDYIEPSSEEGHYSIVSGLSKEYITLNDPWNGKDFKVEIDNFLKRWRNKNSHRWILVISKNML